MPDQSGKLTPEDQEKVKKWLRERWKNWACPFSHDTNWGIGEVLAQATAFAQGNIIVGGPTYPFVVLTCSGCGYTVLLNAIKLGIVTPKTQEVSDAKQ